MIVKRIKNWKEIRDYCRDPLVLSFAHPEEAQCAKGRMNFWMGYEPNYSKGSVKAIPWKLYRLKTVVKYLYPEAELAQVYYSTSYKGISGHRDWRYLEDKARILNLGNGILTIAGERMRLTGGEVIEFNCHTHHRFEAVDCNRVGIGMWRLKPTVKRLP